MNGKAITIIKIVGGLLTIGGSVLGGIASDKQMKETVAKMVEEKLNNK